MSKWRVGKVGKGPGPRIAGIKHSRRSAGAQIRISMAIHDPIASKKKLTVSLKLSTARQNSKSSDTKGLTRRAEVLAACGHPIRLIILRNLLKGPTSHSVLQKVTQCKAGPFHHHISRLRMCGMIGPKQRDVYALSAFGRRVLPVILLINKLST